ncbi:DUF1761 domain-containing protein [Kineosporia sp. A_224]|uniref:DUF1761 domain-containing protein n=1 Tax=Kineosporia sp. A_224 TaxID=1962180 RepID=UPI001179F098|nr:DUF1761 domain-containing protein [Kineosporia sp. A_224]
MVALGLIIASIVAFLLSFMYYSVAPTNPSGPQSPARDSSARPEAWRIAAELLRSALVAGLMTGLLSAAAWDGAGAGAVLGTALWTLPVVLLAGSVLWEAVPAATATVHAGDWLIKLVAIGAIVGAFG